MMVDVVPSQLLVFGVTVMNTATLAPVGTARLYFSRKGVELVDHPANGMSHTGLGAVVATIGSVKCRRCVFVSGRDRSGVRTFVLNECDFDGPVMVKAWYADTSFNETFALCDPATGIAAGGKLTGHNDDHIGRDGRGVVFQGHEPFSNVKNF
jgi:hypothetical protein